MKCSSLTGSALPLALAICGGGLFSGDLASLVGLEAPEIKGSEPRSVWTIGVHTGPSPFQLAPPEGIENPVLTAADVDDLDVDIVAHPFLVSRDSRYYMFFTTKNGKTNIGGIGLAESRNGLDWKYQRAVIQEPFVMSHPYVFEWQGDYYLIPETYKGTSVRLYKAEEFPTKWKYEGDLLEDGEFISPTVVRYHDKWWLFTSAPGNETLRLFYAADLRGRWTEHPLSPIVEKDLNTARPAGRPFVSGGYLYRLGQDCHPTYGNQVHAFRVTKMTPDMYSETMVDVPVVKASLKGWNAKAMHHVDAHQIGPVKWIAVVDALGWKTR